MTRQEAFGLLKCCAFALVLTAGKPPVDDRTSIEQARRQQNAAIMRKDFAAAAATWTQDVSIRAGLGRSLQGRQAYVAAFIADSAMTYVREPAEIVVSTKWPLAYERGHWTGRLRASPSVPLLSGEYSAQWVKSGTLWLIRSEVFVAIDCAGPACSWPAVAPAPET
jgi:ketosteroid isomerase-like protein